MTGRPATRTRGFGTRLVSGKSRVPFPARGTMTFMSHPSVAVFEPHHIVDFASRGLEQVGRRATSHFNSACRIPHSAFGHTFPGRLSLKDDGDVTHAVTHTPHPTQPSGRSTGWPPASIASARSPTGHARAHTPQLTP